ncbi:type IV toxin-antitoxin system AbiEi family antitoxin domain-containing protein [Nocardioides sp. NPDC092400]|uniref:type IV toxin-antitoxin system AbiEi family antitoxin domain-containing protein n=1 Tax=Nocardioides sp. NPDC092400 TaxID=3155196 RepID=UPI00341D2CF2
MSPDLARAFREGHGLVTRSRVLACGVSPEQVRRMVQAGSWVQVRRGVYADRETVDAHVSRKARQLLRDRAACLRVTVPHVRSHESAALELGMDVFLPQQGVTHVTRPGLQGSRNRYGIVHHLAPYLPEEQVTVAGSGARVLGPTRTALDIARYTGGRAGLVAVDSAMRLGVTRADLAVALEAKTSWPGVRRAREIVGLADPGSESVGETLARDLVNSLGFGRAETQFGLTDGRRTVWVDLRLGRHLFEFDGKVKYMRDAAAGLDPSEVVWEEKKRQDFCCGFKLGMSRITWPDVMPSGLVAARARLRREYVDTCTRFGESIADLEPYRPRTARRRRAA